MSLPAIVLINTFMQQGVLLSWLYDVNSRSGKSLFRMDPFVNFVPLLPLCAHMSTRGRRRGFSRNRMRRCCSRTSVFNKFLGFRHSFQSKTFHWDVSRSILHHSLLTVSPPESQAFIDSSLFFLQLSCTTLALTCVKQELKKCKLTVKTEQKLKCGNGYSISASDSCFNIP